MPNSPLVEVSRDMVETETPTNQYVEETPQRVEEPKTEETVSMEKFNEIDKARRAFYEDNKRLKRQLAEQGLPSSNLTLEAIKVGKKLEKFSEDEIDSIAKIIKSDSPNDILAALDNPVIKQGIQVEREKVAAKNKVPAPGSSSPFGISSKSPQEIQAMSREDHMRLEAEVVKERAGGRGI